MSSVLGSVKTRLQAALTSAPDARLRRRRTLLAFISKSLPFIRLALFLAGYAWMLALPYAGLGRGTYIDENALQPGQVNTYWNWLDVHSADLYLADLERLQNGSSTERAKYLKEEFQKLGLLAGTQEYEYLITPPLNGTNAYGVLRAPRASGAEAIVISAPWLSQAGVPDALNLRGVALVLALANFMKGYSLWAKDIVFVIGDGSLDGMHAWLSAYHHAPQSNLVAQPLTSASGVIWTALNIDYPGHSFSHLGVFYEGINGRLPNQDLINSFRVIANRVSGVPVVLYDHADASSADLAPSWIPESIRGRAEVKQYFAGARDVLRHIGYQSQGRASGAHGLYHRFRIDAITLFAIPADGPHGFHTFGKIIESTLRTMNNLLERLHASFFFYLFTSSGTFTKIGNYLPSAILISVALMFTGLQEWSDAGWVQVASEPLNSKEKEKMEQKKIQVNTKSWRTRSRPVIRALGLIAITHAFGFVLFLVLSHWRSADSEFKTSALYVQAIGLISYLSFITSTRFLANLFNSVKRPEEEEASLHSIIRSFTLFISSGVLTITSLLNFSLAAVIAASLGAPLALASTLGTRTTNRVAEIGFTSAASALVLYLLLGPVDPLRNWELYGVWFAPFVCIVYIPILLQTSAVCGMQC